MLDKTTSCMDRLCRSTTSAIVDYWYLSLFLILISFNLGVPLYFFYKLFKNRTELNTKSFSEIYGFWYNGCKDNFYYWEFTLMIKKVLLIGVNKLVVNHNSIYKVINTIVNIMLLSIDI